MIISVKNGNKPFACSNKAMKAVCLKKIVFPALLFLISFITYIPTAHYQNIYLDDDALTANAGADIKDIFKKDVFMGNGVKSGFYRPLLPLSFFIDKKAADLFYKMKSLKNNQEHSDSADNRESHTLVFHHVSNIILHSFFCLLLFYLLIYFEIHYVMAFLGTMLFAVFPPLAAAIAWLGGRNDILLGIFLAASIISLKKFALKNFSSVYLAALREKSQSDTEDIKAKSLFLRMVKYSGIQFCMLSFFFMLAMFTKETAIAFVPLAFLYYAIDFLSFFKKNRLSINTAFHKKTLFLSSAWLALSIFLPCAIYFSLRYNADLAENAFSHISIGVLPQLLYNMASYLLPQSLMNLIPAWLASLFIPLLFLSFFFFFNRILRVESFYSAICLSRNIILGLAWFMFFFIPPLLSSDTPYGWFYMTHRLYVPACGLLLASLSALSYYLTDNSCYTKTVEFINSAVLKDMLEKNAFPLALFAIFFIFSVFNALICIQYFSSCHAFNSRAIAENPKKAGLRYYSLARWHFDRQIFGLAEIYYRKAEEEKYITPYLRLCLAFIENRRGNYYSAYSELKKGLAEFPDDKYIKQNISLFNNYFSFSRINVTSTTGENVK